MQNIRPTIHFDFDHIKGQGYWKLLDNKCPVNHNGLIWWNKNSSNQKSESDLLFMTHIAVCAMRIQEKSDVQWIGKAEFLTVGTVWPLLWPIPGLREPLTVPDSHQCGLAPVFKEAYLRRARHTMTHCGRDRVVVRSSLILPLDFTGTVNLTFSFVQVCPETQQHSLNHRDQKCLQAGYRDHTAINSPQD